MGINFKEDSGDGSSLNFVKLKDKESVRGIFYGDIIDFKKHWLQGQNKSEICQGSGCQFCAQDTVRKPAFRFRINFIVKEGDQYVAKVFEQGWTVYTVMRDLNKDYPLENYVMKVSRSGSGMNDTTYSILPVPGPHGMVTKETHERLAGLQLNQLSPFAQPEPQAQAYQNVSTSMSEDDLPF